jgi:hypothetical protein
VSFLVDTNVIFEVRKGARCAPDLRTAAELEHRARIIRGAPSPRIHPNPWLALIDGEPIPGEPEHRWLARRSGLGETSAFHGQAHDCLQTMNLGPRRRSLPVSSPPARRASFPHFQGQRYSGLSPPSAAKDRGRPPASTRCTPMAPPSPRL